MRLLCEVKDWSGSQCVRGDQLKLSSADDGACREWQSLNRRIQSGRRGRLWRRFLPFWRVFERNGPVCIGAQGRYSVFSRWNRLRGLGENRVEVLRYWACEEDRVREAVETHIDVMALLHLRYQGKDRN